MKNKICICSTSIKLPPRACPQCYRRDFQEIFILVDATIASRSHKEDSLLGSEKL